MLIEDKFIVKAPIQTTWDFIISPEKLSSCIPGLEKVDQIDDRTYDATVKIKVGPIEARFKFTISITEIDPPKHLKATAQGADIGLSKGGSFSMEAEVNLKEISKSETELVYKMVINIIGRFATFGERIIRAKAKEVGMKFMQTVQQKIEGIAARDS